MNFLDKLRLQLKKDESWVDHPYACPAGHMTIGWGHNMEAKPLPPEIQSFLDLHGYIDMIMGDVILDDDIADAMLNCNRLFLDFPRFSEGRRLALANMMFNMGLGTMRKFKKANAAVRSGDWKTAGKEYEDSLWYTQVGSRGRRLVAEIKRG